MKVMQSEEVAIAHCMIFFEFAVLNTLTHDSSDSLVNDQVRQLTMIIGTNKNGRTMNENT